MIAMVNDLMSVSTAFAAMPGTPEKITRPITNAVSDIESAHERLGQANETASQTSALKTDVTKAIGQTLATKLSELSASGQEISPDQKDDLCTAYGSITGVTDEKPEFCVTE
jgi:hypothetical protein